MQKNNKTSLKNEKIVHPREKSEVFQLRSKHKKTNYERNLRNHYFMNQK